MDIFLFLAAEEGLSNWEDISELICQTLLSDPNIITSMILLCQLGFLIIFVLDFDKYMSIINPIGWWIYFHKCVSFLQGCKWINDHAKYRSQKAIERSCKEHNGKSYCLYYFELDFLISFQHPLFQKMGKIVLSFFSFDIKTDKIVIYNYYDSYSKDL